jgi:hypothetical protein
MKIAVTRATWGRHVVVGTTEARDEDSCDKGNLGKARRRRKTQDRRLGFVCKILLQQGHKRIFEVQYEKLHEEKHALFYNERRLN